MNMKYPFFILLLFININYNFSQQIAILKYEGGGDWYANPTALPNLITFCNENINTKIDIKPQVVAADSKEIFSYPIVFMTGHGNVFFNLDTAQNLRTYLLSGGFLHISDNYGMDSFVRKEMKKIFPENEFQEIPLDHPIYNQKYKFTALPKIHEHNNKPSQGFGIFFEGRLLCFYDFESDLSDGWEDKDVHNDPEEIRLNALKMGSNIVEYAFKN